MQYFLGSLEFTVTFLISSSKFPTATGSKLYTGFFSEIFSTKSAVFLSRTDTTDKFDIALLIASLNSSDKSSTFVDPQLAAYVIILSAASTFPNSCEEKPHLDFCKQLKTSSLPITHVSKCSSPFTLFRPVLFLNS